MNLSNIASILSQTIQVPPECTGICADSRTLKPGQLFIAIEGDRFDGHEFVAQAQEQGAVAVVVNRALEGIRIPQFIVPDTVVALAKIAEAHRNTVHCPVIALTGSNGKTTVKEMIAAILPAPSLATKGNLNNHIGAPFSVLQLNNQHRYAVFELGANHPGEIAHTVAIVHPDVTLINNIAPAHIEGFGSIEGVARAKGELYQGLSTTGTAVVNDDDAYAHFWDELLVDKKVLRFSAKHSADVYTQDARLDASGFGHFTLITPKGSVGIELKVPGLHNIQNALAAAACCYAVGLSNEDIKTGLSHFSGVSGRMTLRMGKNNSTLIDDTYNANLRSVLTALEFLAKRPGKKIFIFGDMGELGTFTSQHHQEVGLAARQLGIDRLITCGTNSIVTAEAFGPGGNHFSSQDELVKNVLSDLASDTTVLVKGSRSSAMEKIVHKLMNEE
jgi:UDP-N-acetylmuramoyl-tripeptide--D-alanyl-D-alanine ligase